MADGRDRFAWSVASSLMALVANCHKGKGRALAAKDFNPTLTREERHRDAILITDENIGLMRDKFKRALDGEIILTPLNVKEAEHGRTIGNSGR